MNLIEWPDRLEGITPKERLDLEIKVLSPVCTFTCMLTSLKDISVRDEDSCYEVLV